MSYRPMVLYDPDSDDSSSDGYGDENKASMNIANMKCGESDDGFSISSDLLESVDDEEYDDPMLYANKYNPLNLRVEAGKRVGMDTDDESDGDGDHGAFHVDKEFSLPRAKGGRNCEDTDIDEHSIGSDDEFMITTIPKSFTRNDKEFDDNIPTGNPNQQSTGGAGHHADEFAEGDSDYVHGAKKESQRARLEGKYEEAETGGKKAVARAESKRLVADALAKAREAKTPSAKAFLEAKARRLAEGETTTKRVLLDARFTNKLRTQVENDRKAVYVKPELREKGAKILQEVARKARQRATLTNPLSQELKALRQGETVQRRRAVLAEIKGAGRESAEGGQVARGVKTARGSAVETVTGRPVSALVSRLSPSVALEKTADRLKALLDRERTQKGVKTAIDKLRANVGGKAKEAELEAKAVTFLKTKALQKLREAPAKRADRLATILLKQAVAQKIAGRRINTWIRGIMAQAEFSKEEQRGIREAIASAMLKKPVDEDAEEPDTAPLVGGGGSVRPSEPALSVVAKAGKAVEIGKDAGVSFEGSPVFIRTTAGGSRKLVIGEQVITQTGANLARLEALKRYLLLSTKGKDPVVSALRTIVSGMVDKARQNAKRSGSSSGKTLTV